MGSVVQKSIYGLNNNEQLLVDLFQISHYLMITEAIFEQVNFNYDAVRLDVTHRKYSGADCDWYKEEVKGVLNYYNEPFCNVSYVDEEGYLNCQFEFINKNIYLNMIKLFYKLAIEQFIED